ncbi:hypothetical protein FTO74_07225 [Granulicella sp. WH15]|uniref:hypothetical protein n=1 Tax=Granulicella sp. WH15 TaxID=2602070 RepID=UPI001366BD14|nr:hypothetical protein [Granulicella sp. WH15]QHN03182.1 hypothetical protein FTO74_07225 [Granulicella sp. WH15]
MKQISRSLAAGILVLMALVIGCKKQPSSYEVARVKSPNGSLDAVLTETNGGATTSFGYVVSIEIDGAKTLNPVANLYGALRNEQAYGVNLSWADDHVLRVQYFRAKAVQNVSKTVNVGRQQIEVELQSGIEDAAAPSGGMHYNLTKQSN